MSLTPQKKPSFKCKHLRDFYMLSFAQDTRNIQRDNKGFMPSRRHSSVGK